MTPSPGFTRQSALPTIIFSDSTVLAASGSVKTLLREFKSTVLNNYG
jgi:hypothetical protein